MLSPKNTTRTRTRTLAQRTALPNRKLLMRSFLILKKRKPGISTVPQRLIKGQVSILLGEDLGEGPVDLSEEQQAVEGFRDSPEGASAQRVSARISISRTCLAHSQEDEEAEDLANLLYKKKY